ncbi:putative RNA methyltransferase [Gordonia sp. CPCC 205515]|uniref:putative RNA methyltransferase n=1 Tax=Gordonia sp. CPCC 205515 TaxID=3140791 RepID=UPI003AF39257
MRCPVCGGGVAVAADDNSLICVDAHRFDIARQGYVTLMDGRSSTHRSDTADMVAARRRVHEVGLFDEIASGVADVVASTRPQTGAPGVVFDAGAGTGHYLAAVLDADAHAHGIGMDLSKYCARAVARSHSRAASVVADIWRTLPIGTDEIDAVLSIFSPRNVDEFARVLRPGGLLVVVTPEPDHLGALIAPMRMLSVATGKDERLAAAVATAFDIVDTRTIRADHALDAATITDLVAMGPSAFHRPVDEIRSAAGTLTAHDARRIDVTVSVTVTTCRLR